MGLNKIHSEGNSFHGQKNNDRMFTLKSFNYMERQKLA